MEVPGRGWKISSLEIRSGCFFLWEWKEDGVKTKFPDHTMPTVWFSHCVWLNLAGVFENKGFVLLGHPFLGPLVSGRGFSWILLVWWRVVEVVPVGSFGLEASRVLCQQYMEIIRRSRVSFTQFPSSLGSLSSFHLSESSYISFVVSMDFILLLVYF